MSKVETGTGALLPQLRNRSYNMSQSLNGYPEFQDPFGLVSLLPCYKMFSIIRRPSPSQIFVFIDEHPDTLLDAQFGNPVALPIFPVEWFDMPADRHNQGACLSFADGHAERWRWKVPKVFQFLGQSPTADEMPDFLRVQAAMRTPSAAGEALQRLPAIVPRFWICTEPTSRAAALSASRAGGSGAAIISDHVVAPPIWIAPSCAAIPRISARPDTSSIAAGGRRSTKAGKTSVPPQSIV